MSSLNWKWYNVCTWHHFSRSLKPIIFDYGRMTPWMTNATFSNANAGQILRSSHMAIALTWHKYLIDCEKCQLTNSKNFVMWYCFDQLYTDHTYILDSIFKMTTFFIYMCYLVVSIHISINVFKFFCYFKLIVSMRQKLVISPIK